MDATNTTITIESSRAVAATNEQLRDIVERLGYHSVQEYSQDTLLIASQQDDWQTLREAGYVVVVVSDEYDITEIARVLGVPGRGAALLARMAEESE